MGKPKFHGKTFVENKYTASSSPVSYQVGLDIVQDTSSTVTTWKVAVRVPSGIQKPAKAKWSIQKAPQYVQVVILEDSAYGIEVFINSKLKHTAYTWQCYGTHWFEQREQLLREAMAKYLQANDKVNSCYKVFQVTNVSQICREQVGEGDYRFNNALFKKLVAKLEELETHPELEEFKLKLS